MESFAELAQAVFDGDEDKAAVLVRQLLEQGIDPVIILTDGLTRGLTDVGDKFRSGDVFIPEILASVSAFQEGVTILEPLYEEASAGAGRFLIGTVAGDVHDVGKNLVAMMVKAAGFEVRDLGTDVSPDRFVEQVSQFRPTVIGMSALLTTTMPQMARTIEALDAAGLRDGLKIIVGGAPVNQEFADSIGADGFASDAIGAADLVRALTSG